MASDRCADILIDTDLVRYLGRQAQYERERDSSLLSAEGNAVLAQLTKAIALAPSLQAWCDDVSDQIVLTATRQGFPNRL